jgi:hypothetical protein
VTLTGRRARSPDRPRQHCRRNAGAGGRRLGAPPAARSGRSADGAGAARTLPAAVSPAGRIAARNGRRNLRERARTWQCPADRGMPDHTRPASPITAASLRRLALRLLMFKRTADRHAACRTGPG